MKEFYPKSTDKVFHKAINGSIYRLDAFDNPLRLSEKSKGIPGLELEIISNEDITTAETLISHTHSKDFLRAYKKGEPKDFVNSSGILYQESLYDFVLESAISARNVVFDALENGVSFSLAGGGHHCEKEKPLGFCPINNIAIAAEVTLGRGEKVVTLDLDVHYGNGVFDILKAKENILTTQVWGQYIKKWKFFENKGNILHYQVDKVPDYFEKLEIILDKIAKFEPDIIIYHMGLDVLSSDRMGGIKDFSKDDLIKRESLVKMYAQTVCGAELAIFRGGAYVDYSQSKEKVRRQKDFITETQIELLKLHMG